MPAAVQSAHTSEDGLAVQAMMGTAAMDGTCRMRGLVRAGHAEFCGAMSI